MYKVIKEFSANEVGDIFKLTDGGGFYENKKTGYMYEEELVESSSLFEKVEEVEWKVGDKAVYIGEALTEFITINEITITNKTGEIRYNMNLARNLRKPTEEELEKYYRNID